MREALVDVLIFSLFASQMLHIFGKITVLRGSPRKYNNKFSSKMICLSEDDGAALVWNNLITKYDQPSNQRNMQFSNMDKFYNNTKINCKMNAHENCLELWTKPNWNLTHSFKTPMGPVFDQRWEEFEEYENFEDKYDRVKLPPTAAATLSFSLRVSQDAQILLCSGENYREDFCYWIFIGLRKRESIIRKCPEGVPQAGESPEPLSVCEKPQISVKHIMPLSTTEWRTFVIMWDSVTRNITVYDTNKTIMTYVDAEKLERSSGKYHAFIRSNAAMLFRFHIYNFLHTTVEGANLTSPILNFNNATACIQLLIGLCAECDAHIQLRIVAHNDETLQFRTVKGSLKAAIHGLPMWRSVKIETNVSATNYVIMQLIPKLNAPSSNPLWAIANVRQCPSNGSLRQSVMHIMLDEEQERNSYFRPYVTCQKLFYDEHTVVAPTNTRYEVVTELDAECPEGKIGPRCLFSCERDLESNVNCKSTAICYKDGCMCPPGFTGPKCSLSCERDRYGHDCKKICGSCNNYFASDEGSIASDECNKVNGKCNYGCKNIQKFYIPPLCQAELEEPKAIILTNKTSIQIDILITWKGNYEDKRKIFALLKIQESNETSYALTSESKIYQDTAHFRGYFTNLKSGIIYQLSLRIVAWKFFKILNNIEIDCDPVQSFDITPGENNLIINWRTNEDQLYSCPANWYQLLVQRVDTVEQIVNESAMNFPYEVSSLPSYTSFHVTILHRNYKLFFKETRTLEGVPSMVLNLRRMPSPNTQLTLSWLPPDQPNGEILRYEVVLKTNEYYGCTDLNLSAPNNQTTNTIVKSTTDTAITILDLHPYASYNAYVTAHNSRHCGMSAEIIIKTNRSEIPTEAFSRLIMYYWKLSWAPPDDCTTISGPLKARIKIRGISDAVKDFHLVIETASYYFSLTDIKLHGAERYVAKVYVIRDWRSSENVSAYQKCEFETQPTAPPQVSNLEIVEIDTRSVPETIHLRWQKPLPPLNGKLNYYSIKICKVHIYSNMCVITIYRLNQFCYLWDDYICGTYNLTEINSEIQVLAYNINVTKPSPPVYVTARMISTTPDPPRNCTFAIKDNSVVDLRWYHPWKTGNHLQYFFIQIRKISSILTEHDSQPLDIKIQYPVIDYMRNYSQRLYLFPSTKYHIDIQAVTVANESSKNNTLIIQTPTNMNFDGNLDITQTPLVTDFDSDIDKFDSNVFLKIPSILNNTRDSVMHIIVKGPKPCEQYSEVSKNLRSQLNIKTSYFVWHAAEISSKDLAGTIFTVGDNKTYGRARNCPLKRDKLYEIIVIITEQSSHGESIVLKRSIHIGETQSMYYEEWFIPIVSFVVVTSAISCFCGSRRMQRWLQCR